MLVLFAYEKTSRLNACNINYRAPRLQIGDGSNTLVIAQASEGDIANYTCSAQNGVTDKEGNIIVKTETAGVIVQGEPSHQP